VEIKKGQSRETLGGKKAQYKDKQNKNKTQKTKNNTEY
jgi:hypothetical protein